MFFFLNDLKKYFYMIHSKVGQSLKPDEILLWFEKAVHMSSQYPCFSAAHCLILTNFYKKSTVISHLTVIRLLRDLLRNSLMICLVN